MHLQSEIIDSVDLKSGAFYDAHCPGCGAVIVKHGLTKWEKPLGEVFRDGDSAWGSSMGKSHFPQRFYGGQDWGQCPGCNVDLYWFSLRIVTADKPASLYHLDERMLCNVEMPIHSLEQVALRESDPGLPASWLLTTAAADCCLFVEHKFGPFLQFPTGRPFTSNDFEIENSLKRLWEKLHWGHPGRHICDSLDRLAPTLRADAARRADLAGRPPLTWPDDAAAYPSFPAGCDWDAEASDEPDGGEPEPGPSNPPNSVAPSATVSQDSPAVDVNDAGDVWADEEIKETSEAASESQVKWWDAVTRLRPLADAVAANDVEATRSLLARDERGLREAALAQRQHGRSYRRDGDDINPFMMCAATGRLDLAKELVKVYDPSWVVAWPPGEDGSLAEDCLALGMNALMFASAAKQPAVVSWLVSEFVGKAPDAGWGRAFDKKGRTALMHAALAGDVECVKLLLPWSQPDRQCASGMTALMHAAQSGREAAVRALIPVSDAATIGEYKDSAVCCAAASGDAGTMRALLELPDIRPDDFRAPEGTPLILAAQGDSVELVELLLPLSNPNAQSDDGMTALMHAVRPCGSPEIIKALLRHCDPKWTNADGFTALMHAAYSCNPDTVALLLPESDVCARSSPARKKARKERVSRCAIRSFRNATALTIAAQMLTRRAEVGHVSEELGMTTLRILAEQMKPCDIDPEFAALVRAKEYAAAEAMSESATDQGISEALAPALARSKKHARMASLMPRAFVRYEQFALRLAVVQGEVGAPSESTPPDSELPCPVRATASTPAVRARRL